MTALFISQRSKDWDSLADISDADLNVLEVHPWCLSSNSGQRVPYEKRRLDAARAPGAYFWGEPWKRGRHRGAARRQEGFKGCIPEIMSPTPDQGNLARDSMCFARELQRICGRTRMDNGRDAASAISFVRARSLLQSGHPARYIPFAALC